MDKNLFNLIKSSDDFKKILNEVNIQMKGKCYCIVNADKFLRDSFLSVLLSSAFCTEAHSSVPCGECVKCKQVQNGNNIDICYFGEESGNIKKDVIAEMLSSAITKPYESNRKFLVVKNGDGLNEVDQNMLLKCLEELPEFDTVILMFSDSQKILPTIKSRSRTFLLHSLNEKALVQLFGTSKRSLDIINCTDGNIGKSLELEKMDDFDEVFDYGISLMHNFDRSTNYIYYNTYLQKNKERLQEVLYIIKGVFYMALHNKVETALPKIKLSKLVNLVSNLEIDLNKRQNKLMIIDKLLFGILKIKNID